MRDFLKNLKAGDLVIVEGRLYKSIRKVEKITPSGLIKVNGILYNKDGIERGGDTWSRLYLREATPELVAAVQRDSTIKKAYSLMQSAKNITFEQATKIIEILSTNEQK